MLNAFIENSLEFKFPTVMGITFNNINLELKDKYMIHYIQKVLVLFNQILKDKKISNDFEIYLKNLYHLDLRYYYLVALYLQI